MSSDDDWYAYLSIPDTHARERDDLEPYEPESINERALERE